MNIKQMTSSRPFLLRALNEWILSNELTPHIVVDAAQKDVIVPREFVESGKIVLNISPLAISSLSINNDFMCFSARFSGKAMDVIVPISAVMAIYAKENGQGMVFTDQEVNAKQSQSQEKSKARASERPTLKLVQ